MRFQNTPRLCIFRAFSNQNVKAKISYPDSNSRILSATNPLAPLRIPANNIHLAAMPLQCINQHHLATTHRELPYIAHRIRTRIGERVRFGAVDHVQNTSVARDLDLLKTRAAGVLENVEQAQSLQVPDTNAPIPARADQIR